MHNGPEQDLRDSIPEMVEVMNNARCKPCAFITALALAIRRGIKLSKSQPALSKSFVIAVSIVGLVMIAQLLLLFWLAPASLLIGPALITLFWFAAGSVVAYSQLNLVRQANGLPYHAFGLANSLTLYRFLNIPFLVALLPYFSENRNILLVGTAIFGLAAVSDVVDGNYARITKTVSEFGRIYDPICDIAINAGICLGAWVAGYLPWWYVLLAEIRFFLPLIGGIWLYLARTPWRVRPTILGKMTVFVYVLTIGLLLLREIAQAPFLAELSERFILLSGLLFAFNIVFIFDRGLTMLRGKQKN